MDPPPGFTPPALRPMSIGELVDAAIKLYRKNFKVVLSLAAVIMVPVLVIQAIAVSQMPVIDRDTAPTLEEIKPFLISAGVAGMISALTSPLITGGLSWLAAKFYLGESPTAREALHFALPRFGSLLWVAILSLLATMAGFIFFIIPGILIYLKLVFTPTALVVEGKKGTMALRRSWSLSKGSMGKIFLTLLLTAIITFILSGIVSLPAGLIAALAPGALTNVLNFVLSSAASIVVQPFGLIVLVLLYFDARIRKEAFDLTLMAQEIGPAP